MKLRLPNKLIAAIMTAATPVLFPTLSTATLGTAAVAIISNSRAAAAITTTWAYDSTTNTTTRTDTDEQGNTATTTYAGHVYTWHGLTNYMASTRDQDIGNYTYVTDAEGHTATNIKWNAASSKGNVDRPISFLANNGSSAGNNNPIVTTLRFTADAANRPGNFDFTPLNITGIIVESGATGYVLQGGDRDVVLGNTTANGLTTIAENFTLSSGGNTMYFRGTQTWRVESGKTFTLTNGPKTLESGAALSLTGPGTITFNGSGAFAINGALSIGEGTKVQLNQSTSGSNSIVNGGTLTVADGATLGHAGGTRVTDGGALTFVGKAYLSAGISTEGTGLVNVAGTLTNTGANSDFSGTKLVLNPDTTLSGGAYTLGGHVSGGKSDGNGVASGSFLYSILSGVTESAVAGTTVYSGGSVLTTTFHDGNLVVQTDADFYFVNADETYTSAELFNNTAGVVVQNNAVMTINTHTGTSDGVIHGAVLVKEGSQLILQQNDAMGWSAGNNVKTLIVESGAEVKLAHSSNETFGGLLILDGTISGNSSSKWDMHTQSALAVRENQEATISTSELRLRHNNVNFNIGDGATLTVSANITKNEGNGVLVKSGAGEMKLTGTLTGINGLTLNGGVLSYNHDLSLNSGKAVSGSGDLHILGGTTEMGNRDNGSFTGNILVSGDGATLKLLGGGTGLGAANRDNPNSRYIKAENGGTIDVNGWGDGSTNGYAVTLGDNGSLVNTGGNKDTGSMQIAKLFITGENATAHIGGTGLFGLVGSGHGATSIALNGNTLEKTGANTFMLINTTVNGGGTMRLTEGTLQITTKSTTASGVNFEFNGGSLQLANALTVGGLTMNSEFDGNGTITGGNNLTIELGSGADHAYRGTLTVGALTVKGGADRTQTLNLTGNSTATSLAVQGGATLAIGAGSDTPGALTSSGTTVAANSTLRVDGAGLTLNGTTTATEAGARVVVGESGTLVIGTGASATIADADFASLVQVDGTLTLSGTANINRELKADIATYSKGTYGYLEGVTVGVKKEGSLGTISADNTTWKVGGLSAAQLGLSTTTYNDTTGTLSMSGATEARWFMNTGEGGDFRYTGGAEQAMTAIIINAKNDAEGNTPTLHLETAGEPTGLTSGIIVNNTTALIDLGTDAFLNSGKLVSVNGGEAQLTGSGTFAITEWTLPAEVSFAESGWTGTTRVTRSLNNGDGNLVGSINNLGVKPGSKVELNGVSGWLGGNINAAVVLTGTEQDGTGTALKISNGISDNTRVFENTVSGKGDLEFAWRETTAQGTKFTGNVSEWTGTFKTTGNSTKGVNQGNLTLEFAGNATEINASVFHDRNRDLAVTFTNNNDVVMNGDIGKGSNGRLLNLTAAANVTFTGDVAADTLTINANKTATFRGSATLSGINGSSDSGKGNLTVTTSTGSLAVNGTQAMSLGQLNVSEGGTLTFSGAAVSATALVVRKKNTTVSFTDMLTVAGSRVDIGYAQAALTGADAQSTVATFAGGLTVTGDTANGYALVVGGGYKAVLGGDSSIEGYNLGVQTDGEIVIAESATVTAKRFYNSADSNGKLTVENDASITLTGASTIQKLVDRGTVTLQANTTVKTSLHLEGGTLKLTGGTTTANTIWSSGSGNTIALSGDAVLQTTMAGDNCFQVKGTDTLTIKGNARLNLTTNTSEALTVKAQGSATATLSGTTDFYTIGNTATTITNADVTFSKASNATLGNALSNSAITNSGAGTLTVSNASNTLTAVQAAAGNIIVENGKSSADQGGDRNNTSSLKSVKAEGGNVLLHLKTATSVSLNELVLKDGHKVSADTTTNTSPIALLSDGDSDSTPTYAANIKVGGTQGDPATFEADGVTTINSNLTIAGNTQMVYGPGVTQGENGGVNLADNSLTLSAQGGNIFITDDMMATLNSHQYMTLFTGVSGLTLLDADGNAIEMQETSYHGEIVTYAPASALFAGMDGTQYTVAYNSRTGEVFLAPEPTTTALSLLALSALAARRKRK